MDVTVLERTGYKIPPYRLMCMSKSLSKIIQELMSPSPVMYSVDEALIILEQAAAMVRKGGNGDEA